MKKAIATKYKEWTYIHDPNAPLNKQLQVEPNSEIERPKSLYKYYSFSPFNIEALQNHYLYASSQMEINDPFDCMNLLVSTKNAPIKQLVDFYIKLNHTEKEIRNNYEVFRKKFQVDFALWLYSSYGVISMTENHLNTQMWAYYASAHHGFALKLNLEKLPETLIGPLPINYQESWDAIDIEIGMPLSFLFMTNIKSATWKHEEEWRYIASGRQMSIPRYRDDEKFKNNRKFSYSKDAIEEIVLGWMFWDGMIKKSYDDHYELIIDDKVKYKEQKLSLLTFIVENSIRTSKIELKDGSSKFELENQLLTVERVNETIFILRKV